MLAGGPRAGWEYPGGNGGCAQVMPGSSPPGPQAGAVFLPSVYPLTGRPAVGLQTIVCLFARARKACTGPWHSHQSLVIKSIRGRDLCKQRDRCRGWASCRGWGLHEVAMNFPGLAWPSLPAAHPPKPTMGQPRLLVSPAGSCDPHPALPQSLPGAPVFQREPRTPQIFPQPLQASRSLLK